MKKQFLGAILTIASFTGLAQHKYAAKEIEGRWDLTLETKGQLKPSWLEISHSGLKTFVGHFVGIGGSARPISVIQVNENKISFNIPPQWENSTNDLKFEGTIEGNTIKGSIINPFGEIQPFTGKRAPNLINTQDPKWSKPVSLINSKDLTGWEVLGKENQWVNENGILKSPKSGSNIKTSQTFKDFKLHAEVRYPAESNSGLYLRGRYEVQVADSYGMQPAKDQMGALYGFIQPLTLPVKKAGEWQTYDITLVGRLVTVVLNGETVIYKSEIPGITGGALDAHEENPGPIMIQGDHGPVEYRNLLISIAE
ncbi:MAG: hypothetical protein RJA76_243 [Bacteroidota bacterium]|jgi:hypothetical protein